jgi:hypothetical protein
MPCHLLSGTYTIDATSVAANSLATETFTITGAKTSQCVVVQAPALEAGLVLVSARVSAADTVEIALFNVTGAAVNAASQVMNVRFF